MERFYQQELRRRDEMIQTLLDRIQHPDRTPIWREAPPPLEDEPASISESYAEYYQ